MNKQLTLNGIWEISTDPDSIGEAAGWQLSPPAGLREVTVPHVWQNEDDILFLYTGIVWYFRRFDAALENDANHNYLCFNAVDYSCLVWLNGTLLGRNDGGYLPFRFDVTGVLKEKDNLLVLKVIDPMDNSEIPIGKQGTWYTRVSGIWQEVYIESRPATGIRSVRIAPDIDKMQAVVTLSFYGDAGLGKAGIEILPHLNAADLHRQLTSEVLGSKVEFVVSLAEADLWQPEHPALYECRCTLTTKDGTDTVTELFGMRKFEQHDGCLYLNNKPYYMRGALEQGFYPETVYIAPSDDLIIKEIKAAKEMGFNLLRKHIKAELPRYLYWADRMGMLLWCEAPSYIKWTAQSRRVYEDCLFGMIERDFNHPAIVIWSIFNEEWGLEWSLATDSDMRLYLEKLYDRLKVFDPTRIYCDNSGWAHVKTDINDYHPYVALPEQATFWHSYLHNLNPQDNYVGGYPYRGEVNIISEFGMWGLPTLSSLMENHGGKLPRWFDNQGAALKDPVHNQDFKVPAKAMENFKRYGLDRIFKDFDELAICSQKRMLRGIKSIIEEIRMASSIGGYVITEFSDIEWETNGMLDYFRNPKYGYESIVDFNGSITIMLEPYDHNLISGDKVNLSAIVRNDDALTLEGTLRWEFAGMGCKGEIAVVRSAGSMIRPEEPIAFTVPEVAESGFYTLNLAFYAPDGSLIAKNSEEFTFSPALFSQADNNGVTLYLHKLPEHVVTQLSRRYHTASELGNGVLVVTEQLDDEMMRFCHSGGSVVFFAEGGDELAWKGDFTLCRLNVTEDWNRASALNFIDCKFFEGIPLHKELGWEAQHLLPDYVVPFSDYTKKGGRIVHMTGNREIASKATILAGFAQGWLGQFGGTMLELPYGEGIIRMTTFKLLANYGSHPIANRMLERLLR